MRKVVAILGAVGVTSVLAVPVNAAENPYEVSAAAGQYFFDSDRDLDDDVIMGLGLGYAINSSWTVEGWWSELDTEVDQTSIDVDAKQYRLDALYHFADSGGWKPFLAMGAGEMKFDVENFDDVDETQINLGVGVKRMLSDHLFLRGDLRAFHSLDEEDTDVAALLGLTYAFGSARSAVAAVEPKMMDRDGDGVADNDDACPSTPTGIAVDIQGCPLDSDADGVFDTVDQCPDTASGLKVDGKGCPRELLTPVSMELKINFDTNSDVVKPEYYPEIQRVADFAKQYSNTRIVVEGHTDSLGQANYNKDLSDRRAKAVEAVLEQRFGLPDDSVEGVGYGEEQPVASNDTAEGRAANRRVVATISGQKKAMETK